MPEHSRVIGKINVEKSNTKLITDRSLKNLASSIYQTLRDEGCEHKDILGVSSQLIGLVTAAIEKKS
jgi:N-acetylglucosamine kinase-like BadF-type ATPase